MRPRVDYNPRLATEEFDMRESPGKALRKLLARDQAFTEEDFAEPIATGRCGRHVLVGF